MLSVAVVPARRRRSAGTESASPAGPGRPLIKIPRTACAYHHGAYPSVVVAPSTPPPSKTTGITRDVLVRWEGAWVAARYSFHTWSHSCRRTILVYRHGTHKMRSSTLIRWPTQPPPPAAPPPPSFSPSYLHKSCFYKAHHDIHTCKHSAEDQPEDDCAFGGTVSEHTGQEKGSH